MSADILDDASDIEQQARDDGLAEIRIEIEEGQKSVEFCKFCGEPTKDGAKYCDKWCRDEDERIKQILKKQGVL